MRTSTFLYEGDGLFHDPPRATAADLVPPEPVADNAYLADRRGAAMRRLFPKLSAWLAGARQRWRHEAVYRYLEQARDVHDLEERIRRIERNGGQIPFH